MSFAMSLAVERIRASWRRPRGVLNRIAASRNVALMFLVQSTTGPLVETLCQSKHRVYGHQPTILQARSRPWAFPCLVICPRCRLSAEACSGRCANAGHMLMIPSAEFSAGQGLGAERERPAEATFR